MRFDIEGAEALQRNFSNADRSIAQAFRNISVEFAEQAESVIQEILIRAAAQAGSDAFPVSYIEPMLEAAANTVIIAPNEVAIDLEQMGTYDDLQEGFHYGAKIEGGDRVGLPYEGEPLKNDTQSRYEAWQKVFHGETWHGIDYSGSWSETIAARLEAWGDKAPQWLLLQYGQEEFEPTIQPYPLVEEITAELTVIFEGTLRTEVNAIADSFNAGTTYKPVFSSAPSGRAYYNVRDTKGRFTRRV